jgi:hypothetical protein
MTPTTLLEAYPELGSPFDDEGMSDEEFQLALSLIDGGVFSGDFPSELLTSLFRVPPGANPAV